MGLYVKQNETRSELRQRIENDLREKAKRKAEEEAERPDGVEDSAYLSHTKQTTGLAWVWGLIFLAIGVILGWFLVSSL